MKDGYALCTSCGREPEKKITREKEATLETKSSLEETLEKKITLLSKELEEERDHEKQQNILKSINSMLETIEKIKCKQ